MSVSTALIRQLLNTLLCAAVLSGFYLLGTQLQTALPLPVNGALYGFGLLLSVLFISRSFALWMSQAVQPLLHHMVFFFIPAVMSVSLYKDIFTEYAGAFFVAIVLSTALSLGITAWAAQKWLKSPGQH